MSKETTANNTRTDYLRNEEFTITSGTISHNYIHREAKTRMVRSPVGNESSDVNSMTVQREYGQNEAKEKMK